MCVLFAIVPVRFNRLLRLDSTNSFWGILSEAILTQSMLSAVILIIALFQGISAADNTTLCFPDDFLFGVATSASQIEGAWNKSGRGESMWDRLAHYTNKIEDGSNCDVACDSYHKYKEDIATLKDMGVQFYRLSISWSRILPQGTINSVNQEGVEYYTNVLKLLIENGIEPMVTLYHFDLPQRLSELGGWTNPLLVDFFEDYARICYKLFGQYVKWWLTVNEPSTTCLAGYGLGSHAPGFTTGGTGIYLCAYTHALAHAKAYHVYDKEFRPLQGGKVSAAIASSFLNPNTTADKEIATIGMDFEMGLWANAIYKGDWPQNVKNRTTFRDKLAGLKRNRLPAFSKEEIDYINGTFDFFALNYYGSGLAYTAYNIIDNPRGDSYLRDRGYGSTVNDDWVQASGSSWLYSVPWGLRSLLNWIHKNYNAPDIFITENGWSDDGTSLNDTERIKYLQGHFCNIYHAINEDNIKVLGHTVWSSIDNWEWSGGYIAKFGLVSVNFTDANRTRTPKQSYYWYQKVVANRCVDYDSVCAESLVANW